MTPNDITRCAGRVSGTLLGKVGNVRVTSGFGHVECLRCARRDPPSQDAQAFTMEPPQFINGKCPQRLVRIS